MAPERFRLTRRTAFLLFKDKNYSADDPLIGAVRLRRIPFNKLEAGIAS